jgi:predicted methyltransferase
LLLRITQYVHKVLQDTVRKGDTVIDATMGNGHDTAFLAHLVGEEGKVIAYDIQEKALAETRKILRAQQLESRVVLNHQCHSQMDKPPVPCSAIVFNLGYLPRSDKKITTTVKTTLPAIEQALKYLAVGGLLVLVVYWQHEQGKQEKHSIESFVETLPFSEFIVLKYQFINLTNEPPFVLAVERRESGKK